MGSNNKVSKKFVTLRPIEMKKKRESLIVSFGTKVSINEQKTVEDLLLESFSDDDHNHTIEELIKIRTANPTPVNLR